MNDMVEIVRYISHQLCNPSAAENLANEMIAATEGLAQFPYAMPIHRTAKPLKNEYRKLIVRNYIIFYWVDEATKTVVIARVLYAKRDHEQLLGGI